MFGGRSFRGDGNNYTASYIIVHGDGNNVTGNNCIIYGDGNNVTGSNCEIFGDGNNVSGNNCKVKGDGNHITGKNCTCQGDGNNMGRSNSTHGNRSQTISFHSNSGSESCINRSRSIIYQQNTRPNTQRIIQNVIGPPTRLTDTITTITTNTTTNPTTTTTAPTQKKLKIPDEKEDTEAKEGIKDEDKCCICINNLKCTSIIDCGHYCLCNRCARELLKVKSPTCPMCRKAISDGIIHIY